jgi:hypothetical protein
MVTGSLPRDAPLQRHLQQLVEDGENVVHGLRGQFLHVGLEALVVLVRQRVQPPLPEPGYQVEPQHRLLADDGAELRVPFPRGDDSSSYFC